MLLAAGAVLEERAIAWLAPGWARLVCGITCGALAVGGVIAIAVVLPIAPVNSSWWKVANRLNDDFREEIGWPELVETIAGIHASLPTEERAHVGILAGNYGEAGAIDLYGPAHGPPKAISGVNSYWLRGRPRRRGHKGYDVGLMPSTPHTEKHFQASETVRDVVIGMSDGLTVPFALAAGLSGTVASTTIVVIAGLAEIAAGSIAMGLGGYLAARTDRDHYQSEREREIRETVELPDKETEEVSNVFRGYGMSEQDIAPVVKAVCADQKRWVDFMMRFELGFEEPDPGRARNSAATIAVSYILGGLVPLAPYMLVRQLYSALSVSVVVTLIALFVFGYVKGRLTGISALRGGLQTVTIGGLASAAAFGLARWIS